MPMLCKSGCKMTCMISRGGLLQLSSNVCLNFDGSLALFLPPLYTSLPRSLPRAFCGSARRRGAGDGEKCSTQRACVRVPPQTWETHPHACRHFSNTLRSWEQILTRPLARTHKRAWRGKQTRRNMELLDSLYIKLQAGGVCVVCQRAWLCVCMHVCASVSLMISL